MKINATLRTEVGSSAANRDRREKKVTAVINGKGLESTPVLLDGKDLDNVLKTLGKNAIFDVAVPNGESHQVIIKEIQSATLVNQILDVELQVVKKGEKLVVTVPISVVNAENVKRGIVSQTLNELEIETLPTNIPTEFTVDAGELEIGDALTVSDIKVDKDITVLSDAEQSVVSVLPPSVEEPETTEEASEPSLVGETEEV
ncbi:50S ribosomal protein L25 [Carnobacterium inhibens]|jgi:large subunit ribosomal protein L25|uniref:Large ribosomal subunit protein bL25 n=2 Tax=Carnobacterium inhibens TaxID=147709 RepID=U5SEK5_9LACT|nr:50S ribosomal protein L25 [Carnobacterium inhibens]AGY82297.1 50S ribosomal protein L25 [Carnobacterium inhibens subsp. gilichinskyi]MBC9824440.1 50S ribosomal protein L25 [Carnobacterium inhibens]MCM3511813.1 50S ribosomal protein L25 [Carnobacterium inhibens]